MRLSFQDATVIWSNLGGLGGQPGTSGHDGTPSNTVAPSIRYGNVGRTTVEATNTIIELDLEISNLTAYNAYNTGNNGIKEAAEGDRPSFAVINLLSPRQHETTQSTKLRFTILDHATGQPVALPRTFFTFFDLDEANNYQQSGDYMQRECLGATGYVRFPSRPCITLSHCRPPHLISRAEPPPPPDLHPTLAPAGARLLEQHDRAAAGTDGRVDRLLQLRRRADHRLPRRLLREHGRHAARQPDRHRAARGPSARPRDPIRDRGRRSL